MIFAIFNLSTVAVLWFGAMRVESGDLPIGNLTAFLQYLLQILFATLTAVFMFILIPRAAVSSGRIREVLDTEPSIHDPAVPVLPAPDGLDRGVVEFRDLEFRYPGAEQPVLRDISFRAEPGKTTAIVGSTGSGKSTLINLIPRFYDASSGTVLVDGIDVRAMNRDDLWDRIGVIPQKAFLFSGTVGSNLRFGKADATEEELWRALEIAQGKDFVSEMEGGLDAPIAQGGTNVSGGQRQRLVDRPCDRQGRRDLRLRRQLQRARLRDGRPPPGGPRARARRRDRDHRRPARRHDPERRPDRRHGRRRGRRDRHPPRAAGDQRDLPRDRLLAAVRVGGRGMTAERPTGGNGTGPGTSGTTPATLPAAARRGRPRRSGRPGWRRRPGGPGMFGMGMGLPPQKSKDFGGSLRRLFGHLRPEAPRIVLVIVLAVVSVFFAVIGPKILGNAIEPDLRGGDQQDAAGRA